jgi:hypothetical protein
MIEYTDGTVEWLLDGKLHREDGPAIEYANGTKQWWLDGKLHREDGPAIEWSIGTKQWWLDGEEYTKEEFVKKTRDAKELSIAEIEAILGYKIKVVK